VHRPRASIDWLATATAFELNLFIQFPFRKRDSIPSGHRLQNLDDSFWSISQIFSLFYPFWFLFNYGKLFVVYFSDDEFNWRMKYLMIYLTKQIVQLPLGFVYFYFALFFARKPRFRFSLLFRPCACRYLITNCAMKRKRKCSKNIIIFFGEILNYWDEGCVDLMKCFLITLCISELLVWCWTLLELGLFYLLFLQLSLDIWIILGRESFV
jgi:hypothetical protein